MATYTEMVKARWNSGNFLCVGLDPDMEKLPEHLRGAGTHDALVAFSRGIIDATKDLVCAYKPNMAFFEMHGDQGIDALRHIIAYINEAAPDVPVILDAKRADIGNTNDMYARAAFDHLHAHAITVNPYPGKTALLPFLERKDKGVIVWCRTSNEGAGEFQDLLVEGEPLYLKVARNVSEAWNENGNCSLVVGATYPDELRAVRAIVGDMPILIPGVGAQNGDLAKSVQAGKDGSGTGFIIAVSRAILYADTGKDFQAAAHTKAEELAAEIKKALQ